MEEKIPAEINIIFLDIDGVLNVYPQGHDEYGAIFHQHFMDNLKRIVDATNAKIVVSSTWRSCGLTELQKMWKDRGLAGEVIDITPYGSMKMRYYDREEVPQTQWSVPRGSEVQNWLLEKRYHYKESVIIKNYVILDDDIDFILSQQDNFVRCSENPDHEDCVDCGMGLTSKCTDKAIEILNKNK